MQGKVDGASKTIIEAARLPFLVLDPEMRVLAANPSFCKAFQVTLEEIVGKPLDQVRGFGWFHSRLKEALSGLHGEERSFDDVEVEVDVNGIGRKTLRLNARLIAPDLGPGAHTVLSIEDVTDRIRAEKDLHDSEMRFRRLFESAQDGILILDVDTGRIEQANPYLASLMDSAVPDLLGKELWEIGIFENREASRQAFRRLRETGYIRFEDLPLAAPSGRKIEAEFVCNVYDVGDRAMAQCNIRDVGDRKRAERALRAAEKERRKYLKAEAIAKLAGGVAHEYNNLLTAINGYAALSLPLADPQSTLHANLAEILAAGERAAGITRQLLAYSRQQVLEPKLVDPNALLARVRALMEELSGKKIEIEEELDPDVGWVVADPGQIEQALLNLAVNARNAMPEGGRLTLKTGRADLEPGQVIGADPVKPGPYAFLAISDTGVGMNEEVLARIFDPFYSTQARPGGPGLGLSMVQGIIAQSGGQIVAESAPGRGSTFKIYLPIASGIPDKV